MARSEIRGEGFEIPDPERVRHAVQLTAAAIAAGKVDPHNDEQVNSQLE